MFEVRLVRFEGDFYVILYRKDGETVKKIANFGNSSENSDAYDTATKIAEFLNGEDPK